MTEHDPLCVWHNPNDRAFARGPVGASGCTCDIRRETRADLRAKVEGLPKGRDRESGLWCIEVDVLLALLEEKP